jgi:hypothetical protein
MTPLTPPEDFTDVEHELAQLRPPELSDTARARLRTIPTRFAQPKLWAPSPRLRRTALTLWAAAAAVGLFFGGSGAFDANGEDGEQAQIAASAEAELDLLAELSLPADAIEELP